MPKIAPLLAKKSSHLTCGFVCVMHSVLLVHSVFMFFS